MEMWSLSWRGDVTRRDTYASRYSTDARSMVAFPALSRSAFRLTADVPKCGLAHTDDGRPARLVPDVSSVSLVGRAVRRRTRGAPSKEETMIVRHLRTAILAGLLAVVSFGPTASASVED